MHSCGPCRITTGHLRQLSLLQLFSSSTSYILFVLRIVQLHFYLEDMFSFLEFLISLNCHIDQSGKQHPYMINIDLTNGEY